MSNTEIPISKSILKTEKNKMPILQQKSKKNSNIDFETKRIQVSFNP